MQIAFSFWRRVPSVCFVTALLVLTHVAFTVWIGRCASQEKPREAKTATVDLLASQNKVPVRGDGPLTLPPNYDFDEQKRVWAEINRLFREAEPKWAEIVDHLDDQRYCLTMESNVSGRSYEWTVGDVCHAIVARNLTQGYYGSLKPETFDRYRTLRSPVFVRGDGELKR